MIELGLYIRHRVQSVKIAVMTSVNRLGLNNGMTELFAGLTQRMSALLNAVLVVYNSYFCFVDAYLIADPIHHVSDQHFFTGSLMAGYMLFDTALILIRWFDVQEDGAASLVTSLVHHSIVLGCCPIGMLYNSNAWMGSGVFIFWGEATNVCISLVWILRCLVGTDHPLYAINGVIFALTFIPIRTVVMGYYIALWIPHVLENRDECLAVTPCGASVLLIISVYAIGLFWVPQVWHKVSRGLSKFLQSRHQKAQVKQD